MSDRSNDGSVHGNSPAGRLAAWLEKHARLVIGSVVALTAGLSVPMLVMQPTETASQYPAGEVIDAQLRASELFAGPVHRVLLVAEARDGDILAKAPLLELLEARRDLTAHPRLSRVLADTFHPPTGRRATGLFTIADAVDQTLQTRGVIDGLAGATETQVSNAIGELLTASSPSDLGLAVQTAQADDGRWSSPAAVFAVDADNFALGGGGTLVTIGTDDTTKEQFARDVLSVFRHHGSHLETWTVAADLNLTSNEQGRAAGPFIAMTIVAVLAVLGISFRSYWTVAVSGAALGMLMIWLKGGSNLIGLENDQLLATVVPISMISFGIDSAFHAIGRYREHGAAGQRPGRAYVTAIGSILAALTLAVTSDAVAFLSNVTSSIESVVQFGLAAALAALSAFALLGLVAPLALSRIEARVGSGGMTRFGPMADLALGLLAAVGAAVPVMAIVFVSPALGLALLILYVWLFLVWPFQTRRLAPVSAPADTPVGLRSERLARLIRAASAHSGVTLTVAGVLTLGMLWSASHLETRFDVRDFFSEDVDFVVGLDKVDRYVGDRGGEPALILIEADLEEPEVLAAIDRVSGDLAALDSDRLARTDGGEVLVHRGVLDIVDRIMGTPLGIAGVETATGIRPTDQDTDGLPDTRDHAAAILTTAIERGLPSIDGRPPMSPQEVGALVARLPDGGYATTLGLEIPNTKVQSNIVQARAELQPIADRLETELRYADPAASTVLTGSAVFRDEQLSAIFRSLLVALPVAVVACLMVATVFMRSLRFALVSVVPILIVVVWLYGIMQLAGYGINVVTAIIGAISVGVGIDFATHFAMRYLEESQRHPQRLQAMEAAGAGTGTALLGSAGTSFIGFGILAFAPMPMFATYGLLTAVMIALALAASLIVLPALLIRLRPPGIIELEIPEGTEAWSTAVLGSLAAHDDATQEERTREPVAAFALARSRETADATGPNGGRGKTDLPAGLTRSTALLDGDHSPGGLLDAAGTDRRALATNDPHREPAASAAPVAPAASGDRNPTIPVPPREPEAVNPGRTAADSSAGPGPAIAGASPEPSIASGGRRPDHLMLDETPAAVPPSWHRPVAFQAPPGLAAPSGDAPDPSPDRTGRHVSPTSAAASPGRRSEPASEPFLRLGLATELPPTIARMVIAGVTSVSNPGTIRLLDGVGEDLIREIRGGILDIGIVTRWPTQDALPPGVKAGELASTVLALAVRAGSRVRGRADLEKASWVSGPPWSPHDDAISIACTRAGFRPFVTHRVSSPRLALEIVRGTGAITLLPRALAREADAAGVTLHGLPDLGKFRVMVVIPTEAPDRRVEETALAIREATTALRGPATGPTPLRRG